MSYERLSASLAGCHKTGETHPWLHRLEIRILFKQSFLRGENMETSITIGWVLSVLTMVPFFLGGTLFILRMGPPMKSQEHIGFPLDLVTAFGVIKILIGILTLVPATSLVGVILATGWMGGAIAAHVRVRDSYLYQVVIPILIWVGFGLRHQAAMHSLLGF
jgi:hypothetical protein